MPGKSLVVYLTAGWPDRATFLKAAKVAAEEGADLLEVGLPFSDPIADGPTIQKTSSAAIRAGMNYDRALDLSQRLPPGLPRALMTYANPLFVRGWAGAFGEIRRAGFAGCILPDVPAEELVTYLPFRPRGFYLVPFVAPTTADDRLARVADAARDGAFIYMVSLRGITGARLSAAAEREIAGRVRAIRRVSHAPVYVGFGVRSGAWAARLARLSDGVIVGTAALEALRRGLGPFGRLLRELRRSIDIRPPAI
ncbi:MAG: tryptophan synthase subunit alpha [Candidatus Lindowbacteria bacterium RIFCSPLOWO2_12_FULL_62_27]|nr:MAG: tryptophan synthase subunit alpha [Candidatus Lindowbacteria bacterium RIFCSPLOWO2_02_FULL_62_12]OGH62675.1 MAG: tryptophan synthase subunit alpha [Candidatus Lindowbacteria bacterium RIFCSPLOWO2_12_FULL_62_27]